MISMFCTLEEAAEKLGTTTAEVEVMVANGTFREFRDGATQLVKSADVEAMAAASCTTTAVGTGPHHRPDTRDDRSAAQAIGEPAHEVDIKLPAAAPCPSSRAESTRRREGREPASAPALDYERTSSERPRPVRAVRPSTRHIQADTSTQRLTLRQWMWMGLVDDRPHVLITLFLVVTAGIGGLAAAVYLLTRVL